MLCAIYSDVAPIMVYFYGNIYQSGLSAYGPLVKDCSPQYFGENMVESVPDGRNPEEVVPGTHIPVSSEFMAWAEGSLYGPAHLVGNSSHWALDRAELSSGFAELNYYVIARPKEEYTDELSVDDGIESIEPDATVLALDYDTSLDDWSDSTGSWEWSSGLPREPDDPPEKEDICSVLLRLDRLNDDYTNEDYGEDYDGGYLISAEMLYVDTYLYSQKTEFDDEDDGEAEYRI